MNGFYGTCYVESLITNLVSNFKYFLNLLLLIIWNRIFIACAPISSVGDSTVEIITGGYAFTGGQIKSQLRIWNWDGSTTLTLEKSEEWYTIGFTYQEKELG